MQEEALKARERKREREGERGDKQKKGNENNEKTKDRQHHPEQAIQDIRSITIRINYPVSYQTRALSNFEPQSWPETITTRDAKSARLKGPRTSYREIISGISWPNHGLKRSHHVMDASCRQTNILSGKNQSSSKQQEEKRVSTNIAP